MQLLKHRNRIGSILKKRDQTTSIVGFLAGSILYGNSSYGFPAHEQSPGEVLTHWHRRRKKALLGNVVEEPGFIIVQPSAPPTISIHRARHKNFVATSYSLLADRLGLCVISCFESML